MLVADVVLSVRNSLGDTNLSTAKYSNPEIIDSINATLATLSEELLFFHRTWIFQCVADVYRYKLPDDFLKLISVSINGKVVQHVESLEHRAQTENYEFGVSVYQNVLHIYGGHNAGDTIEVSYNHYESIDELADEINLPPTTKELIVYGALHRLYLKPISKDSINKSGYYLQLFEKKIKDVKSRIRSNQQSKNITTKFRGV